MGAMSETVEYLSRSVVGASVLVFSVAALVVVSVLLMNLSLRHRQKVAAARVALIAPWTHAALDTASRVMEPLDEPLHGTKLSPGERELARRLKHFGIAARFAPALLFTAQACAAVCLAGLSWYFGWHPAPAGNSVVVRMAMALAAGVLGWYLPALSLRWAAQRRVAVVVAGLPDALELLVICAEGGLALGDGIDRIVTELARSQPQLAQELALTAADLKLLPSQAQALGRLAERIDSPIVQSVVTTLSQTIRFGTPFAQAMRRVASEMRNDALIRMEERANKLPALLTVPMILLIIPPIFVVIGGPAALALMDSFAR